MCADTVTTTYGLTKPEVGASEDSWGLKLNDNLDELDNLLDGTTPVTGIDINSGTIDGAVIGGATPAAGTFTTLTANTSIGGTLSTAAQPNVTSVGTLTSLDVSGNLSFGDNDKAIFGAGSDLRIYSDGTHSYIEEQNSTGSLYIDATDLQLRSAANAKYFRGLSGGAVDLYYDNSPKLATTSTGIDVTGTVTADGLTVQGSGVTAVIEASSSNAGLRLSALATNTGVRNWDIRSNSAAYGDLLFLQGASQGATPSVKRMAIDVNGDISFYEDTGTTPKFFWDASAESLGIGTSSPSRVAELYNTSNPALRINNGTDVADIGLASSAGALVTGSTSGALVLSRGGANAINLGTNGQNRVTIDSSGNVGIGTSSPSRKLHVSSSQQTISLLQTSSSVGQIDIQNATATSSIAASGADLYFYVNSAERMRIDSSGNVGIGTSSPSELLHVNGTIRSGVGTAADPSIKVGDNNTGFYYVGGDALGVTTGGSERMRLDSSGNLLVGTTDTNPASSNVAGGIALRESGQVNVSRDDNPPLQLNRKTADGDIAVFQKDGSTVGSLAAYGGDLNIGTGNVRLKFTDSVPAFLPRKANDANSDNYADLGDVNNRFKDLYLSGGVYLGGTGSANKLDDYEEGTWTPTFRSGFSGAPTFNTRGARYTKIGRMVYCDFYIQVTGTGSSGQLQIEGLPFSSTSNSLSRGGGLSTYVDLVTGSTMQFYGGPSISYFSCYIDGNAAPSFSGSVSNKYLIGIYTYETDA